MEKKKIIVHSHIISPSRTAFQHLLYQSKRKQRQNLHNKQHAIIINSSITDYKQVSHKEAYRWRLSNGKEGIQEDSYTWRSSLGILDGPTKFDHYTVSKSKLLHWVAKLQILTLEETSYNIMCPDTVYMYYFLTGLCLYGLLNFMFTKVWDESIVLLTMYLL